MNDNQSISQTGNAGGKELPTGTRLEEFVIERVLGSGGFGITYLARDTSLNRQVVIKENLPSQFAHRDTTSLTVRPGPSREDADNFQWSLENFSYEGEMLASLRHPGIVAVLRRFNAFGTAYFVMPFVEGVALDELIRERADTGQMFSEAELKGWLPQILDALAHLHERGIYHRDIKPGNILITNDGIPVLIDFGSARRCLSERSMTVIESPGYTPFEQLESRGNVGPWSDLYALGGTLEKAITNATPPKVMDRMRSDPRIPLAERKDLPEYYSPVFLRAIDMALEIEEKDRWQNAGEWLEVLREKALMNPALAAAPKQNPSVIYVPPLPVNPPFPATPRQAPTIILPSPMSRPHAGSAKKTNLVSLAVAAFFVLVVFAVTKSIFGDEAETTSAQTRNAEERIAQAEQENQKLIAQVKAREEADAKEAERQRAARVEQERLAKIAQEKAQAEAEAKAAIAARSKVGSKAGEEKDFEIAAGMKMTFCWIPPGEFLMGSPVGEAGRDDDEHQHRVTISKGFWLAKTEMTQSQWQAVMRNNPSSLKGDDLPVESVSWNDIASTGGFLEKANRFAGGEGRFSLPTEAQWEYACRAGTTGVYAGNLDQMAWFAENSGMKTHPVSQKQANAWGLQDMHGNVWEWCADWHGPYPDSVTNPQGAPSGSYRVRRGGSWGGHAYHCRVADRGRSYPAGSDGSVGFRIARSSAP
jgi:formylglycine-generating enzyme required for sulfatase activity